MVIYWECGKTQKIIWRKNLVMELNKKKEWSLVRVRSGEVSLSSLNNGAEDSLTRVTSTSWEMSHNPWDLVDCEPKRAKETNNILFIPSDYQNRPLNMTIELPEDQLCQYWKTNTLNFSCCIPQRNFLHLESQQEDKRLLTNIGQKIVVLRRPRRK